MAPNRPGPDSNFSSMFIVPTDRPGWEARAIKGKLGLRAQDTAEVSLADLEALRALSGYDGPDVSRTLLKGWKDDASPRGPIMIDPETRDIVQNEYMRRVEKVNGALANVEFETMQMVKDPWKEINRQK